eukprot:2656527-Amphidinium_carterae.1
MKLVTVEKPQPGLHKMRKKARACICGNFQWESQDANYSAYVPDWMHIRIAINLASRLGWSAGLLD